MYDIIVRSYDIIIITGHYDIMSRYDIIGLNRVSTFQIMMLRPPSVPGTRTGALRPGPGRARARHGITSTSSSPARATGGPGYSGPPPPVASGVLVSRASRTDPGAARKLTPSAVRHPGDSSPSHESLARPLPRRVTRRLPPPGGARAPRLRRAAEASR